MNEKTEEETVEAIISILRAKGPLTTRELEEELRGKGHRCPDGAVRFFNKLRISGKISGKVSVEKRGWIWWVEN
ncbi:MAG: hypothetical protein QXT63_03550 [Thermoplasmata archaeon]